MYVYIHLSMTHDLELYHGPIHFASSDIICFFGKCQKLPAFPSADIKDTFIEINYF